MSISTFLKTILDYSYVAKRKKFLLNKSEVFCMAPWIQIHAQTNGMAAPCCMASFHGGNKIGDLHEDPDLLSIWNSEPMKILRKDMLNERRNSICNHCYEYERIGKFSERQQYNRDFKADFKKVATTLPNGTVTNFKIPLLDIRFSNKCNYKCRICDSEFSAQWYDEEQQTGKKPKMDSAKEMLVARDKDKFWESYKQLVPNVKRLHFAGGEPLFMEEHYKTLEYLISVGRTKLTLSYNTNLSTLQYKKYNLVELWNRFEKVDVWASLDGKNERGDYQRKGQNWKKIEDNIRVIQRECKTVLFGVNTTVSILNVLEIPSFYKYMVINNFVQPDRMNLYLLFDPSYYAITNLTPNLKKQVITQFKEFEERFLNKMSGEQVANFKNHINAVITFMMAKEGREQKEFKHWIETIDKLRGENFTAIFPELAEMVQ